MRRKWTALIAVCLFILVALFYSINLLDRFTLLVYDFLIRTTPVQIDENVPVMLVSATERFSSQTGHDPRRDDYAKLIELLSKSKIIVSDIFFPSPQSKKSDMYLRNSMIKHSDKIILPVFTPYRISKEQKREFGYTVDLLNENYQYFQSAVKYTGHINVFPDSDTIVRKCPAFIYYKGVAHPHIAIRAFSVYHRDKPISTSIFTFQKKAKGIIPINKRDACFNIRFLKPETLADMVYPMEDVLTGKIQPDIFKDKVVIIGHTIIGSKNADLIPTPMGVEFGAIVQMQALYTVFSNRYISTIDPVFALLITLLAVCILSLNFLSSFWRGTNSFVFIVLAIISATLILFRKNDIFFDPVPALFSGTLSYIGFVIMNFFEARTEISRGQELLSILESTQREIAVALKPHEIHGIGEQKRAYLPALQNDFFNKTPLLTLKTITSLLGISEGVIFSVDRSTEKPTILVANKDLTIGTEVLSIAVSILSSEKVKMMNKNIPPELKNYGISNCLILQILEEPTMKIYGFFSNKKPGAISSMRFFTNNDYQWIASFCLQIVIALFNTQLNDVLKKSQLEMIMRLAAAVEYRDRETGAHISRVSEYCALIASGINLPQIEVDLIKSAVPLHDLGKIAIPDSVLLKPSSLTEDEKQIIRQHTIIGAKMLEGSDSFILQAAYLIALYHHEKFDGTGYPYGIKGTAIPLYGRIASLADVFDAISSKRTYKEAQSFESTIQHIINLSGKDFDPKIVDAFVKNKDIAFEIYRKYINLE